MDQTNNSDINKTNFWFMNINPSGGDEEFNKKAALCFCQKKSIIGLGWPISEKVSSPNDAKKALGEIKDKGYTDRGKKTVLRFLEEVNEDSYVWIYHKVERAYYLCKVTSKWYNNKKSTDIGGKHDIGWHRKAEWKEIERKFIPSCILRNPHMSTLSRIALSDDIKKYLISLFEDEDKFKEDISDAKIEMSLKDKKEKGIDIIELFEPDSIEDMVCNYLQSKEWRLIKSTASKSLPDFECIFRRSDKTPFRRLYNILFRRLDKTPNTAYVQVKSGKKEITKKDIILYKKTVKKENVLIYIFEQKEKKQYSLENVIQITSEKITDYILDHIPELNPETRFKIYIQNKTSKAW